MKDVSIFDIWTVIHILAGIAIGSALIYLTNTKNTKIKENKNIIIYVLVIAYLWEILEYTFEIGIFGSSVKHFFYGVEFLPNRLIADPLSVLIGGLIAIKKPKLGIAAGIIAILFFLFNVFFLPDTVYLQRFL